MKPQKNPADRGAGSGCMARFVRFSSFLAVVGAAGDAWAADKGQNLVNQPLGGGLVWHVESETHGPGLAAYQLITKREDLGPIGNPSVSVTVPDSVSNIVNSLHDQGIRGAVVVIQLPANSEHQGPESRISTLPLLPPRDKASGGESNCKTTSGTVSGNPVHYSKWVTALSITAGQIAGLLLGGIFFMILTGSFNLRWLRK